MVEIIDKWNSFVESFARKIQYYHFPFFHV